ncbi:MAG: methyltransferase domain-containing protein [Phycisphaeraceae bacterium]|nr:methyltransferase domain-containing protein [Phycisphaeraceae bacterium]
MSARHVADSGTTKSTRPGKPWVKGIWILHEDDHIWVLDKPAGMTVALGPGEKVNPRFSTLVDVAAAAAKEAGGSSPRPRAVNWIEPAASGVVVVAKTPAAAAGLREQFREGAVHPVLYAVVKGIPRGKVGASGSIEGLISSPVIEPALVRPGTRASRRAGGTQPAVTRFRVLGSSAGKSLVRLELETDRPGQAVQHMRSIGTPILGDVSEGAAWMAGGGASSSARDRLMLHVSEVSVKHPSTGAMLRLVSPPPPLFRTLVKEGDAASAASTADDSWEHVAEWYGSLVGSGASDHHQQVILPGVLRLLEPASGERLLDVACGEGLLCREAVRMCMEAVGVDASTSLIDRAIRQAPAGCRYETGDARRLDPSVLGRFDMAACVLAIMNIDPVSAVFHGVAQCLKPGGRFVLVMLHPAFRSPRQTSWGWETTAEGLRQYRRVDAYLSTGSSQIVMNPGAAAHGAESVTTTTYHRPVGVYVRGLAKAGFVVDAMEEWASVRKSQPGPRAAEENRARREIPMFLAIRAVRGADATADGQEAGGEGVKGTDEV